MDGQNFTTAILVDQSASEVFKAINNPRGWWSEEIEGTTDKLNAEWHYHFGDNHRSKMKVIEMVPGQKVVWLVEENYFKNAKDQSEWVGNKITFEISKQGDKTKLAFTQIGLVPAYACYKSCEWAWTGFVQKSLHSLITTGKGQLTWYQEK
ncbi:MAG TPA: SRPBCC domain-containing protein [Chitinophagaceae bacterium]|nr:SRPBCC domain-containing protein [Chitinophagaceae bacterium]